MARMSNRDRIAKMAAEAKATESEKAEKKTKKPAAKKKKSSKATTKSAASAEPAGRLKIVWLVCDSSGKPVKTFPYPAKAQAEAEVAALTEKKGRPYILRSEKVPMD